MIRALIAWGPATTWATVLFLLSEVGGVTPIVFFAVHDKPVHLGLYGVLGATLAWGKRMSGTALPHWALILLGVGYGAVDELHQYFVPNRVPSGSDLVADAIGILLGYGLLLAFSGAAARIRTQPTH